MGLCGNSPFFVVETETLNGTVEAPVTLTEEAQGVQAAFVGAPVQDRLTVPVKPPVGVTCRLYVAICPAVTPADVEPPLAADIEKSGGGNAILATKASPFPPGVDWKAPAVASPGERVTPVPRILAGFVDVSRPIPVPMSPAAPPK